LETVAKKLYEAMFLIDSAQAAGDWDGTMAAIKAVLERSDAEIVSIRKWGDRRLAYEIDHKSRGMYVLCYFRADGQAVRGIEKDVGLSEQIMRVLVLSTEGRAPEEIEKDMLLEPTDARESERQASDPDADDAVTVQETAAERVGDNVEEDAAVEQETADAEATQDSAGLLSEPADDREQ
jgi:small subunit ribosomal protein S6